MSALVKLAIDESSSDVVGNGIVSKDIVSAMVSLPKKSEKKEKKNNKEKRKINHFFRRKNEK